ncbi:MAG TPA: sugar isomerase domain-containing protein [Bryobacteraceae bacterium]|nr:sugar isomerase domain-containing protein [Bryobacteraceae bacterium]
MSAAKYYENISAVLAAIHETQQVQIERAAEAMANAIAAGKRVYLYGSGHSVIPVMDVFPRYGSFVGFFPLYDPRLMWWNVVGPGGARELLWLERREGYAEVFLQSYPLEPGDVMIVFSHGGMNAAPIEAALYAKNKGLTVITVSSLANARASEATHSSGKKLPDAADIAIDNCVAPEDSQVDVGRPEKVAAGSTMAAVFIAMSLVAETGARLAARGHQLVTFVSPNVPGIEKDHNPRVFEAYSKALFSRGRE